MVKRPRRTTTNLKQAVANTSGRNLSKDDIMRLRKTTLGVVNKRIVDAAKVLDGKKEWNNQQVRLFGMLLNKVMPDLHHSVVQGEFEVTEKNANELTREQLQEIASRGYHIAQQDDDIEDAEYEDVTDETLAADLELVEEENPDGPPEMPVLRRPLPDTND